MSVCAYCNKKRATHRDHVVPKSLRKTHALAWANLPDDLRELVPSCHECNWRKGTRRLVPAYWANRITRLGALFPGTPWRVWTGDVTEPAFREVHVG